MDKLPTHIAFIMDGNRRWAKTQNLSKFVGHEIGFNRVKTAVSHCANLGIKFVSIYAFSTENWNREQSEIDSIFQIIRDNMHTAKADFIRENIRVVTSGDITRFPMDMQKTLKDLITATQNNTRCTLNLCINYGGRSDIVRAANSLNGKQVSEAEFANRLYAADLPDIDFLVRTSGEQRISNFMLWHLSYAEFYFSKLYWPAITPKFIDRCVTEYKKRNRRFGKN